MLHSGAIVVILVLVNQALDLAVWAFVGDIWYRNDSSVTLALLFRKLKKKGHYASK